jgi:hypothetical protein
MKNHQTTRYSRIGLFGEGLAAVIGYALDRFFLHASQEE